MAPPFIRIFKIDGVQTAEEAVKKAEEMMKNLPPPKIPTIEDMVAEFDAHILNSIMSFSQEMMMQGASGFDVNRSMHLALAHNAGLVEAMRKHGEADAFVIQAVDEDTKKQITLGRAHHQSHVDGKGCPDNAFELKDEAKAKA